MNIPLFWLAEYVELPKSESELTDKLTMVGHMLNKKWTTDDGEVVIDLELRGNRSDLFGIIGIAREVSAIWNKELKLPKVYGLPDFAKASPGKPTLVTVKATDLVERFLAFQLDVKVGPSPSWLVKRLTDYGLQSINNVVDITNYVMVETGEPMHAYDIDKLAGERLILRQANENERFTTLAGTVLSLNPSDLVIADENEVQGMTMIGGKNSGVSESTTRIILEAAVYNQANVRRSARRLNVSTEAGARHEKLLDPNQVEFALSRALQLLTDLADAKVAEGGEACDFYPNPKEPKQIELMTTDTKRLTDTDISVVEQMRILESLGCHIVNKNEVLEVYPPTFRTDIEQAEDLVEEIIRIYGYEKIPPLTLSGELPNDQTSKDLKLEDKIRDSLVKMGVNEVITSPIGQTNDEAVKIVNAPDLDNASLRTNLSSNLIKYTKRNVEFKSERVALFEIGKVYFKDGENYSEENRAAIILGGKLSTKSWDKDYRNITEHDLLGTLEVLFDDLNLEVEDIPYIQVIKIYKQNFYYVEFPIDSLLTAKPKKAKINLVPPYPSVIEDLTFEAKDTSNIAEFLKNCEQIDLVKNATLVSTFDNKRTIRVEYTSNERGLSTKDILPSKNQLMEKAAQWKLRLI